MDRITENNNFVGFGIGLRPEHYDDILQQKPDVDWFEIISEDFLVEGGSPLYYLDQVRQDYPVAMHGVSLSIGSCDPLDRNYLKRLKNLMQRIQPLWVSDHFCWTGVQGINLHDLMPLPHTEEGIQHVVNRIQQVQDYLGQQILLENVSSYVDYKISQIPEWEFITTIAERADCLLLLDINNIYVNSFNHGFDPLTYLNNVPTARIKQFHLAGHKNCHTHIVDTHDDKIIQEVWRLYEAALRRFGPVATLIERDANIPPLQELLAEMKQARKIAATIQANLEFV